MTLNIQNLPPEIVQYHILPQLNSEELVAFALSNRTHFWNVYEVLQVQWLESFSGIWQVSASPIIDGNISVNNRQQKPNIAPRQVLVAYMQLMLQQKIGLNAQEARHFLDQYKRRRFYTVCNAVNFVEVLNAITYYKKIPLSELYAQHFKYFFLNGSIKGRRIFWYELARKGMFNSQHQHGLDPIEIGSAANLTLTPNAELAILVNQAQTLTLKELLLSRQRKLPDNRTEMALDLNQIYTLLKGDVLKFAQTLWEQNLKINDQYLGLSLLHMAAQVKAVGHANLLLDYGIDPNVIDAGRYTPLMIAVKTCKFNVNVMVAILLSYGAYPNAQNVNGDTALHICASENNIANAPILLSWGANPYMFNKQGNLPLHMAAKHNNIRIIEILTQWGIRLDTLNKRGESALHVAARFAAKTALKRLLEKGLDVNAQCSKGYTPLHLAVIGNDPYAIEILLSYNPNPEITNIFQATPLMLARRYHNAKVIHLLECYASHNKVRQKPLAMFLYPHYQQTLVNNIVPAPVNRPRPN